MNTARNFLLILFASAFLSSCSDDVDNKGHSTPIDSTNENGTAPATYGADNPANDQDTIYPNSSDTGTGSSHMPEQNQ